MGAQTNQTGGGSVTDILTAIKNIVVALNNAALSYNNVNGVSTKEAISAPTVVKTTPGRVCAVSITTAGSATGMIYDATNLNTTTAPLWVIPAAAASNGQPYVVNLPTDSGILVVPGTGQVLTLSWS
jgi:hypothetical protein